MMSPITQNKGKQFAFVLSAAELDMLTDLAAKDGMSKSNLVRLWIRAEYLKAYPTKRPRATIPVTLRALIGELSGPEHRTAGNIAERMRWEVSRVNHYLDWLQTKTGQLGTKVVQCVDAEGRKANWTWELRVPPQKALQAIEAAGFDLDHPLAQVNPDADDDGGAR